LIRGGRDPLLQMRPTLQVLALLAERRLLPPENEHELATKPTTSCAASSTACNT
jgi:glutamine synthetase adenylyltransferase